MGLQHARGWPDLPLGANRMTTSIQGLSRISSTTGEFLKNRPTQNLKPIGSLGASTQCRKQQGLKSGTWGLPGEFLAHLVAFFIRFSTSSPCASENIKKAPR